MSTAEILFLNWDKQVEDIIASRGGDMSDMYFASQDGGALLESGDPVLFIDFWATPKGMNREEFMEALGKSLIANGVTDGLSVESASIQGKLKAFLNGSPTGTLTVKHFKFPGDRLDAGGYAKLNDPNSMIIYTGLSRSGANRKVDQWMYVNGALHETGHGVFGFSHESRTGYTDYSSSIMDYRGVWKQGAGFSPSEQIIIMESKWGKD
jgi:hypothetical protein